MIRYIELLKINELYEGHNRTEQLEEIADLIKSVLDVTEGITGYKLDYKATLDPMDADLYLEVDFENRDALEEYDLSVEHLAASIKIAEHCQSILQYDLEV